MSEYDDDVVERPGNGLAIASLVLGLVATVVVTTLVTRTAQRALQQTTGE